jgi:hypothetical protein
MTTEEQKQEADSTQDIGLSGDQVKEIRAFISQGNFAAALGAINANSKSEIPGVKDDIRDAMAEPPGPKQWACVRRPDLAVSLMGVAGGDELIMHACEAAVHWAIPKEGTDPDLYAFTRELHPFVMELCSPGKARDGFLEYAEEMQAKAHKWLLKAVEVQGKGSDAELDQLMEYGNIALAGRYSETARLWSMLRSHEDNCEEGPDCPAGKMAQRMFLEQAVGVIQGCHLQKQVGLRLRKDFDKQSAETIQKARLQVVSDCTQVMREAVPFSLLRAYADGTVVRTVACAAGEPN